MKLRSFQCQRDATVSGVNWAWELDSSGSRRNGHSAFYVHGGKDRGPHKGVTSLLLSSWKQEQISSQVTSRLHQWVSATSPNSFLGFQMIHDMNMEASPTSSVVSFIPAYLLLFMQVLGRPANLTLTHTLSAMVPMLFRLNAASACQWSEFQPRLAVPNHVYWYFSTFFQQSSS